MRHFRISDQNPIKTKRLLLTPLNAKQLAALEAEEKDELLRGALGEMRKNVTDYYDLALWHTGWQISLRNGGQVVGLLGFHGVTVNQTVELGYEIREEFRGNGYGEEAVKALCDWAFGCEGVYFISALAAEDNTASNHILEKLKFYRVQSPVSGMNAWELERPASAWMSIYMCFGLAIGLTFGQTLFQNMAIGLAIGIGAGLALGSGLDAQDRAARKRANAPKKLDAPEEQKKTK
ncbi:MAG TPA: GNAT family N-acetyltransferase [Clostridia bacterium]|nr:GNAT family N-acetyltransferase [Clostridia bacterium]